MKFYVGNLNFRITEDQLRALFEPYGPITDLIILTDRETGRSRGFGFITLADDDKAKQAYADLNQSEFEGRTLVMNEARPRTEGPHQGGGGGHQSRPSNSNAPGYSRSTGGGYSNQTYSNRNAESSSDGGGSAQASPQDADNGYAGEDSEQESGGYSGGGGYSRGGNH